MGLPEGVVASRRCARLPPLLLSQLSLDIKLLLPQEKKTAVDEAMEIKKRKRLERDPLHQGLIVQVGAAGDDGASDCAPAAAWSIG